MAGDAAAALGLGVGKKKRRGKKGKAVGLVEKSALAKEFEKVICSRLGVQALGRWLGGWNWGWAQQAHGLTGLHALHDRRLTPGPPVLHPSDCWSNTHTLFACNPTPEKHPWAASSGCA